MHYRDEYPLSDQVIDGKSKDLTWEEGKYHRLHFLEVCLSHFPSLLTASFQTQTGSSDSPVIPKQAQSTHPLTDLKGKSQMVTITARCSGAIRNFSTCFRIRDKNEAERGVVGMRACDFLGQLLGFLFIDFGTIEI